MNRIAAIAFAVTACCATTCAQAVNPPVSRLTMPWPAGPEYQPGAMRDLAVGAFVAGRPAKCAVVLRDTELFLLYQPTTFAHCSPAGDLGLTRIATIGGISGRQDRIAGLSSQGLHVLKLTSSGFVNANAGPLANWSTATDVDSGVFADNGVRTAYVLAWSAAGLRAASIADDGTVTNIAGWPVPPGSQLLDACFVDWVPQGHPEIAVLTTAGVGVVAAGGTVLTMEAGATTAGRVVAWNGPGPAVTAVRQQGAVWAVDTVFPFPLGPVAGGTLSLAAPLVDVAVVHGNDDLYGELVVSTEDSVRRVLVGASGGPQATDVIEVYDADPLPAGVNLAPLAVADVDDDGDDDFVVAQGAADALVVVPDVRRQLLAHVWNVIQSEIDDRLGCEVVIGHDGDPQDVEALWPSGSGGIGVRFVLPALDDLQSRVLLVTVYPVDVDATIDVDDPVLLEPHDYEYTFGPGSPTTADVVFPVDAFDDTGLVRYLVEARLVESTANGYVNSNTPRFLYFGLRNGSDYGHEEFASLLTTEHLEGWVFEHVEFTDAALFGSTPMAANASQSPGTPPYTGGNRFVGCMDIPKPHKKNNARPTLPPPGTAVPLGPAAGH